MTTEEIFFNIVYPVIVGVAITIAPKFYQIYRQRSKESIQRVLKDMDEPDFYEKQKRKAAMNAGAAIYYMAACLLFFTLSGTSIIFRGVQVIMAIASAGYALAFVNRAKLTIPYGAKKQKEYYAERLGKLE